jgi:N-acetyl-anhydromuramyl-L-alanine amidase AmpD
MSRTELSMTLNRLWKPSPNFSSARARNYLVVCHTSEGADTEASLANFLAQPSAQVSYQVCFDDFGDPNTITECVRPENKAWAAMAANDWGVHGCLATPSGASAGWSRDVWLSKATMLDKCARWIAEECDRYNIPLTKIGAGDINAGRKGVCGHGDCSAAGAGGSHTDPGPNFPWAHVIALAGGAAPAPGPVGVFPVYPRRFPVSAIGGA